mmetsp:Transcript_771/g.1861  ORF Transcript_771/g.1861 Transcript_771/m.1861 type:complete len:214 (-) Transcript_771:51-692(-)
MLSISPRIADRRLDFPDPTDPTTATRVPVEMWVVMFRSVMTGVLSAALSSVETLEALRASRFWSTLLLFSSLSVLSVAFDLRFARFSARRLARSAFSFFFERSSWWMGLTTGPSGSIHPKDPSRMVMLPDFSRSVASAGRTSFASSAGGASGSTYGLSSGRLRYRSNRLREIIDWINWSNPIGIKAKGNRIKLNRATVVKAVAAVSGWFWMLT